MANKTAGIKLTLSAAGFSAGLGGAEAEAKKKATSIGGAFKRALSDGVKGGVDAVRGAFSSLKSTIGSIAGIAGGIGLGELLHSAVAAEGSFRKFAFAVRAGKGEALAFRDAQRDVQRAALDTGQSSEELGKAMQAVFTETGDADFARGTLAQIGTAATAAHEPVETMAALVGTLNEKFGITEEQIGSTLASAISLGNKGGVSVGDLGEKLGLVGAFAKEAGLAGEDGFAKTIALLNIADNSTGNFKKSLSAVGGLLEQLGNGQQRAKAAAMLGIDPSKLKGDATQQIGAILQATKGNKGALEKAFQGEQLKVLVDLGKTYASSFEATKGDVQTKTKAGLSAYAEALAQAGKSTLSYDDLRKEAATEMQSSERQMAVALEKLRQGFAKPEITEAITKLMSKLPALAEVIASLVDFSVQHPVLAAGGAVAGTFGKGFLGGAMGGAPGVVKAALTAGSPAAQAALAAKSAADGASDLVTFRKALNDNVGPLGKLAAAAGAAAAVYAAVDQADKLNTELGDTGWSDMFAKLKNDLGITTDAEFQREQGIVSGYGQGDVSGQGPDTFTEYDAQARQRQVDAAMANPGPRADAEAPWSFIAAGPEDAARGAPKPAAPAGGGMSAENARLFADMMGTKKLRVEITNPEAIRGGTPGPGGAAPPQAGRLPRK